MDDTKTFLGIGFALVIGIIIAVNLISSLGQVTAPMTNYISVNNATLSLVSSRGTGGAMDANIQLYPWGSNATNMTLDSVVIRNATSGIAIVSANYTVNYTQGNATVQFVNTSEFTEGTGLYLTNTSYIDYKYYDLSQYIQEGLPKQFVDYTVLFFALGIIALALYYVYKGGWLSGADNL